MPITFKTVQVSWSWAGDTFALRGFNLMITTSDSTPTTEGGVNAIARASVPAGVTSYNFLQVPLQTGVNYTTWVQAYYDGGDSDWVSNGQVSVADDGVNTIPTTGALLSAINGLGLRVNQAFFDISAPQAAIDDNDAGISYVGTWISNTSENHFGGTAQSSHTTNDYFQYTFTGTGVNIYHASGPNRGTVQVFIDGSSVGTFDGYSADYVYRQKIYSINTLTYGQHTVKVMINGKNASSSGYYFVFDFLETLNTEPGANSITAIDDTNGNIVYAGATWTTQTDATPCYNKTQTYSDVANASITYNFKGTGIRVYDTGSANRGKIDLYIDNNFVSTLDCYSATAAFKRKLYENTTLGFGNHIIKMVVRADKNASSTGYAFAFDYFEVLDIEPKNNGELYLHGFNTNGVAADVPGFLYYNGVKIAINNQQINTDVQIPRGYIVLDKSTGKCFIVTYTAGVWYCYNTNIWSNSTTLTLTNNHLFIGYVEMDNSEDFTIAQLFNAALSAGQVYQLALVDSWKSSTDVTKIEGGNIYTGSIFLDKLYCNGALSVVSNGRAVTYSGGTQSSGGIGGGGNTPLWTVTSTGQYAIIDLGASLADLRAITFTSYWATDWHYIPNDYTIDYSTDNLTWTNLVSITGNVNSMPTHKFNVQARYIKITVNAFQTGYTKAYICNFKIWGFQGVTIIDGGNIKTNSINTDKVTTNFADDLIISAPDSVRMAVGNLGAANLIKNGNGRMAGTNWTADSGITLTAYDGRANSSINNFYLVMSQTGTGNLYTWQKDIPCKASTTYTVSGLYYFPSNVKGMSIDIIGSTATGATANYTHNVFSDNAYSGKHTPYKLTFTTAANEKYLNVKITHMGSTNAASAPAQMFIQLEEGSMASAYRSNDEELKNTIAELTNDRFRVTYSDGSYSEMNPATGFMWYKAGTGKPYHYLMEMGTASVSSNSPVTITLGSEFKGKNFYVVATVNAASISSNGDAMTGFQCYVDNYNTPNGTFRLNGYVNSSAISLSTISGYEADSSSFYLSNASLSIIGGYFSSMTIQWIAIA